MFPRLLLDSFFNGGVRRVNHILDWNTFNVTGPINRNISDLPNTKTPVDFAGSSCCNMHLSIH